MRIRTSNARSCWRQDACRWSAERDTPQLGALFITDGQYALRLMSDDVTEIVNAPVVANVGAVLERAAGGKKGREDLRSAFARDDRPLSEQWREIRTAVTEFANAGAHDDDGA